MGSQKHASYITSTRLDQEVWRGTISAYLLHFKEQLRLYEETAEQGYTGQQKIKFLQNALAGTPELNCVYQQNSTAARAAGVTKTITWDEYFAMLLEVANVLDAGRTFHSNPRRKQSTNMMELLFDDADEVQYATLEAHIHSVMDERLDQEEEQWDQDTTLEQLEASLF